MNNTIVVFSTCGSQEEAEKIARHLVEERVAACVNIIAPVRSIYRWRGVVESAEEWMLMIKTSRELFQRLCVTLETAHSYEVPEILALPVVGGSAGYLSWLQEEVRDGK